MVTRIISGLVIIVILAIAIPPFFFQKEITPFEIRYYVVVFLLCTMIMCFSVLRMYNATVHNTRFVILLKNSINMLMTEMRKLKGVVDKNVKELHRVKDSVDRSINEIRASTEKIIREKRK